LRLKRTLSMCIVIALILIWPRGAMTEQQDGSDETDLAAYYGFKEIEIIKLNKGAQSLQVCDFNGDGLADIAVADNSKARIQLLIQSEELAAREDTVIVNSQDVDINQITPMSRFRKEVVPVTESINDFAAADLNSDGLIDLVYYGYPKGLYIIYQKKPESTDGSTLSWKTKKKIDIDDGLKNSSSLAIADLNADGRADLAVAATQAVYILFQKENGRLAEPEKYPTGTQLLGLMTGDINGDKLTDLVLITNDDEKRIYVRFGLEGGQLGPQRKFTIQRPYVLELFDINEDSAKELLMVGASTGRLNCYQLAGVQEEDSEWPMLYYPLPWGEGINDRDLVIDDFTGDGLQDIVISEPGSAELIFYCQEKRLGLGKPVRFPTYSGIDALSSADIDEDGKAELAVLSVKEKVIGISKFQDQRFIFPKPISTIGEPAAMDLADIDADGNLDCVYCSRKPAKANMRDYFMLGVNKNLRQTVANGSSGNPADQNEPDKPVFELEKVKGQITGMKVADFDRDSLADVLVFLDYEPPVHLRQVEAGKFERIDRPSAQSSLISKAGVNSMTVADLDAEKGSEILIAQDNFARSLFFNESQTWQIIDQYNAKTRQNRISTVAAFNLDPQNDDSPEILLLDGQKGRLQILSAGEDKTYRLQHEIDVGQWSESPHLKIAFAPLTGAKSSSSILLFDAAKFAVIVPPGDDTKAASLEKEFSYETKIKDGIYGLLTVGDINSDKRPDIIMLDYKNNNIEILTLDSELKPVPTMRFKVFEKKTYSDQERNKSQIEPREMKVADVTNDGKADLVTLIHDRLIIYPQD